MLIAVYAYNSWSQDIIVGYTSVRIPMFNNTNNNNNNNNSNVVECDLYRPISSNAMSEFIAWMKGNPPEYYDITTIAKSDVREVTRVKSNGTVRVSFNILTKNLKSFGYSVNDESIDKKSLNFITAGGIASLGAINKTTETIIEKDNEKQEKEKDNDKENVDANANSNANVGNLVNRLKSKQDVN